MIAAENRTVYKAFGFQVLSEIPLPELPTLTGLQNSEEIVVEVADLTTLWSETLTPNKYFFIKENLCLFQIPNVAIFLVKEGNKIIVSPMEGSAEDQIRLYILGTCMGAILLQRKILPMHGSAIAIDGKAYAIVGDSGAGKSTLASAFLNKGYQLISDDVIPVTLSEENTPLVTPAYPQQKLWLESLDQFGMESNQYRPIIDRETKFAVPVVSQFVEEPMPLAGVCELVKADSDEIEILPIQRLERFHTLFNHTYRNFFIAQSGLMEWHFSTCAKMVNKIELYQLRRPMTRFTAHDLTDLMLNIIQKGEKVSD
ncbi:aldolase [Peribacillus cavernae]|uniref:Aldolase n=1 Tax=Peribacillus cavernae TaxID=1674310 RepID=A0A433HP36_9BACI|nr:aldolase [Peribacillus cavernae]MDQ0217474.1 hypothetical protein [Peribacillus cavernae]RUQ30083.1 aldolase [Peribacillus cavernae]